MKAERREALAFARTLIRNRIDQEGVYDPKADYVMPGRNLLQYLVHAYEVGRQIEAARMGVR